MGIKDIIKKLNYILIKEEKVKVSFLFIMMIIGGTLEMAGVSLVLPLVGMITGDNGQGSENISIYALILICVYVVKNLFLMWMYASIFRFVFDGATRLSARLMDTYLKADYTYHLKRNVAEIARVVRDDTGSAYGMLKAFLQMISEILICFVLAIFLLYTDITMSLFLIVLLGGVCGLYLLFSKKVSLKLGKENLESQGQIGRSILQGFGGIKEVKLLGCEDYFLDQMVSARIVKSRCNQKQQLLAQIPRLIVETVCIIGVMCIIIYDIHVGKELNTLIPKLSVFAVAAFRMLPSVGKINTYMNEMLFLKPATDSVYNDLKKLEKIEKTDNGKEDKSTEPLKWENTIEIQDLSFGYNVEESIILEGLGFSIKRGEAVGLIGPSGAGKTTLADLIMGLLTPNKGCILVDGIDIQDDLRGWQRNIGYVPQTIYLSDDTIRKNVAFGIRSEDIDDNKVWEALRRAQLEDFVKKSTHGLDTQVGDRGVRLSGGQRQRIGIARALYHDPNLLVFDEATSALDNETEEAVMQAIESLHGEKTMIIIAHRLSTIKKCDRVYRVENKRIERVEVN